MELVQERHDHDLGLAHDLRVLSRRRMFHLAGVAGASAVVAACAGGTSKQASGTTEAASSTATAADAAACIAIAPAETAGPYPGDGSNGPNVLIASGLFAAISGPASAPTSAPPTGFRPRST